MFNYPLIAGDKKTALAESNTIVLTETLVRKLFNVRGNDSQPVIGQLIKKDCEPGKEPQIGVTQTLI